MVHNMNKVKMLDFEEKGDDRGQMTIVEAGGGVTVALSI